MKADRSNPPAADSAKISESDYYFENFTGSNYMFGGGNFTGLLTSDASVGAETIGTVPRARLGFQQHGGSVQLQHRDLPG